MRPQVGKSSVRVDSDDSAEIVFRRDSGEHHRGLSLEAADLHGYAAGRSAGSQGAEEAQFIFREETVDFPRKLRSGFDNLMKIRGQPG